MKIGRFEIKRHKKKNFLEQYLKNTDKYVRDSIKRFNKLEIKLDELDSRFKHQYNVLQDQISCQVSTDIRMSKIEESIVSITKVLDALTKKK